MEPTINTSAKSLLAKLLATENISVQQNSAAKTASFNVKSRILQLPAWKGISEDLHDMLVVHEVGHALDTPCDGWLDAIKRIAQNVNGSADNRYASAVKGFLNVVEDARIDKRQKRRYPGTRRNYLAGYKELIDRDFFGLKNRDPNSMTFIDRANLYFKGGSINMNLQFTAEERPLLKRMEEAETFEQVVALTEEIYRLAKLQKEDDQQQTPSNDFNMDEGDGEGEEVEFDLDDDADGDEGDAGDDAGNDEDVDGEEADGSKPGDSDEDEEEGDSESSNPGRKGGSNDDDAPPVSETDKAYEENRELMADDSIRYRYVSLPTPNMNALVDDYKKVLAEHEAFYSKTNYSYEDDWMPTVAKSLAAFRVEENDTISYMVKEFEQRKAADIYAHVSTAKTGVIDTNKIHSYRYNDDIFRRSSIVPQGKNHGFVMIIDWSGSMINNLKYTIRQLLTLTMFCKRVQIPFEVYLFRDGHSSKEKKFTYTDISTSSYIEMSEQVILRNIVSSRMSIKELNQAYLYLWAASFRVPYCDRMSGTPLNESIFIADEIVNNFRKKNKLQVVNTIFLTDGESYTNRVRNAASDIEHNAEGKRIKNVYIIQDTKTKREYTLTDRYASNLTTSLFKMLKARTESNLLGFFLADTTSFSKLSYRFPALYPGSEKSWSDNNFVPLTNEGYDEYYVINPKSFRETAVPEKMNINNTMTKNRIAREFLRYSEKKSINRLLLSRFMEKVAGKVKNAA